MAGIIDEHGQWEQCSNCGDFVLMQHLTYEEPSEQFKYGRDLCKPCLNADPTTRRKRNIIGSLKTMLDKTEWRLHNTNLSDEEMERLEKRVSKAWRGIVNYHLTDEQLNR